MSEKKAIFYINEDSKIFTEIFEYLKEKEVVINKTCVNKNKNVKKKENK